MKGVGLAEFTDRDSIGTSGVGEPPATIVEREGSEAEYLAQLFREHQKAHPGYVSTFKVAYWTDGETCSLVRQIRLVRPAALAFGGVVVWLEQTRPNGPISLFSITRTQWELWRSSSGRGMGEVGR